MSNLPEAVWFGLARFGYLFGIDQVPGTPVTLDEAPSSGDINGVPGVTEPVILKFHPGLVTRRFAVAFDNHTVQSGITEKREDFTSKKSWTIVMQWMLLFCMPPLCQFHGLLVPNCQRRTLFNIVSLNQRLKHKSRKLMWLEPPYFFLFAKKSAKKVFSHKSNRSLIETWRKYRKRNIREIIVFDGSTFLEMTIAPKPQSWKKYAKL